jgi:hypothetical protein
MIDLKKNLFDLFYEKKRIDKDYKFEKYMIDKSNIKLEFDIDLI